METRTRSRHVHGPPVRRGLWGGQSGDAGSGCLRPTRPEDPGRLRAQSQRDKSPVARPFKRAPPEPPLALTALLLAPALEDRPALERGRRVALTPRGGATQIQGTRLTPVWGVAAVACRTAAAHARYLPTRERLLTVLVAHNPASPRRGLDMKPGFDASGRRLGPPSEVTDPVGWVQWSWAMRLRMRVRNWINAGQLPSVRVGSRRVRIKRSDLDRFLTAGAKPATDAEAFWTGENVALLSVWG